jgi:hypothetical protein
MGILYVERRGFKMAGRKHECSTATRYEPAILFPAEAIVIGDFTLEAWSGKKKPKVGSHPSSA